MITRDFLTAGNAIFTVSNPTGKYYTYRVTAPDYQRKDKPIWFVSVLTGPDNTRDYTYLGILLNNGLVKCTTKSKFKDGSISFDVAKWAINLIWNAYSLPSYSLASGYKIEHIGQCGRCGRPLTTPESLESGIGPICKGKGRKTKEINNDGNSYASYGSEQWGD